MPTYKETFMFEFVQIDIQNNNIIMMRMILKR